jgi:hypothetical protein
MPVRGHEAVHDLGDSRLRRLMDEFPNISGFNYRIARHKIGNEGYYRIYECFYDENGKVVFGVNHCSTVNSSRL